MHLKQKSYKGTISTHLRVYSCPPVLRDGLIRALTFKNPAYEIASRFSPWGVARMSPTVCLAEEYEEYVQVPRAFNAKKFLLPDELRLWKRVKWIDHRTKFNVKFPPCRLQANDDQKAVLARFKKAESDNACPTGAYLFVVPTAGGKTLCSAMLSSLTGQRTLVLCKTDLIKRAWEEDLHKGFGLGTKDIGVIKQKKLTLGKHFTLASIATLARRKHLWHEIFSKVGCLVIDECQVTACSTVRAIVESCPSHYVFGLTATPKRRDGQDYILDHFLGKPLLRIENKQEETGSSLPLGGARYVKTALTYADKNGKPLDREDLIYNDLAEAIVTSADRDKLICDEVYKDWKAGHTVLITTRRVDHVQRLKKRLMSMGVRDVNHLDGSTNADSFYTSKLLESIDKGTSRCLVATEQAISVGANIPALSRLHVAFPPSSADLLEQLVGRIRRKHKRKKDAKMTYYMDLRVPYLFRKFKSVFIPTMRKLKVPGFEELYIA